MCCRLNESRSSSFVLSCGRCHVTNACHSCLEWVYPSKEKVLWNEHSHPLINESDLFIHLTVVLAATDTSEGEETPGKNWW